MRWLFVVALGGCGFHHGALQADAGPGDTPPNLVDEGVDAPADATRANCYAQWLDGTIRFNTAVALAGVNDAGFDRDPFLAGNELTFFVSTLRTGSMGSDIFTATRASKSDTFSTPVRDDAFSSSGGESKLSITADGLTAIVGSDRTGTAGGIDIWETTRATTNDAWPAMTRDRVMMLESAGSDHDPTISADGLRIYYAPDSPVQHIAVATRANRNSNFGAPVTITQLASGTGDADPSPTPDERIIVFSSNRTLAGALNGNMWYATRASASATFDTPQPVPDLNTDASEGDPHLSTDGCRIYFARNGGATDWDIYVATAQ
ncbi:MAG TPA: hypothetical protein VLB44_11175 [Kofleriaceae bacterium]|nr:hypothetical protein [Kofleriaceae bacterium]